MDQLQKKLHELKEHNIDPGRVYNFEMYEAISRPRQESPEIEGTYWKSLFIGYIICYLYMKLFYTKKWFEIYDLFVFHAQPDKPYYQIQSLNVMPTSCYDNEITDHEVTYDTKKIKLEQLKLQKHFHTTKYYYRNELDVFGTRLNIYRDKAFKRDMQIDRFTKNIERKYNLESL